MAALDKILDGMASRKAQALTMKTGELPLLHVGRDTYPVLKSPLVEKHIIAYVKELAGPDHLTQIEQRKSCSFHYKGFQIHVTFTSDFVAAEVKPIGKPSVELAVTMRNGAPAFQEKGRSGSHVQPASPIELDLTGPGAPPSIAQQAAAARAVALQSQGTEIDFGFKAEQKQEPPAASRQSSRSLRAVTLDPPDMNNPQVAAGRRPIDELFREMIKRGASDLHLTTGEPPLFRIDGSMVRSSHAVVTSHQMKELVWPICPEKNREEYERCRDTDFAYAIDGLARFRANVFMDRTGMGAVFRQIPSKILSAEQLRLPKPVVDLCWLNKGLVVVTGPTGSGKTTTLAALIDFINHNRAEHLITMEDPIEFVHKSDKCLINQREIGVHTDSFKHALRAALREDPDIILVGEMRDLETVAMAIETAETGHLVFGTLHTNTAPSTIDRIIDQFPTDRQAQVRIMLSESLKGVIAQTLCKKVGGGRIAAYEILLVNSAIANLIREGKTFQIPSILQTQRAAGNTTLNDSLLELVKAGLVEPQEAYVKAVDKSGFKAALERISAPKA